VEREEEQQCTTNGDAGGAAPTSPLANRDGLTEEEFLALEQVLAQPFPLPSLDGDVLSQP
jgi:hypothetical protein